MRFAQGRLLKRRIMLQNCKSRRTLAGTNTLGVALGDVPLLLDCYLAKWRLGHPQAETVVMKPMPTEHPAQRQQHFQDNASRERPKVSAIMMWKQNIHQQKTLDTSVERSYRIPLTIGQRKTHETSRASDAHAYLVGLSLCAGSLTEGCRGSSGMTFLSHETHVSCGSLQPKTLTRKSTNGKREG